VDVHKCGASPVTQLSIGAKVKLRMDGYIIHNS